MRGQCICGKVEFEVLGKTPNLYQCHCKLCRKQGGSASNTATMVDKKNFSWVSGEEDITFYKKDTGFSSNFCSTCGCPVPNQLRDLDYQWIPAGLLEDDSKLSVIAHIYTASKAGWDEVKEGQFNFETMPSVEEFVAILNS
ncbi:MAG: GFA family protein [Kangiellaceae bacterium]